MDDWQCCDKISFEVVEEKDPDAASGTHVVLCCHCGKIIHLHHFFGTHIRLTKIAHKLGLELKL